MSWGYRFLHFTPMQSSEALPILSSADVLDHVIEWDAGNWSRALGYWLRQTNLSLHNSECLDLGSRGGGLSLWLASQGAKVICSDLTLPGDHARQLHARYGVSDQIRYQALDATNLPHSNNLDVVCYKSVLGALSTDGSTKEQEAAMVGMWKALRPGGELWFAENLSASPLHGALRSRFVKWGQRWRYPTLPEMQSFLAPFSSVTMTTVGFLGTFGRTERQRRRLALIDQWGFEKLVPTTWRYIVFGLARK